MKLHPHRYVTKGFSLIEITLSIGIIAFALVAVLGLLPAGLNSQKDAADQSRGVQVLSDLTQAVRGIYGEPGAEKFAPPLQNVKVDPGVEPLGTEVSFAVMEDGTLRNLTDPSASSLQRRGTVFVNQRPRVNNAPRAVFLSVAWPHTAIRAGKGWSKASGSTSVYVFAPK